MPSFLGCLATARHLRHFFLVFFGVTFVCVCARGGGGGVLMIIWTLRIIKSIITIPDTRAACSAQSFVVIYLHSVSRASFSKPIFCMSSA